MKSQIFYLFSIIGMALNFASCSTEDLVNANDPETNSVHFDVYIPTGELRTRGFGDGNSISNLRCYVYSSDTELPIFTQNVNIISKDGKNGGTLNIDLPSSGAYDFIFLATSCPQDDKSSKIYYNSTERTLNLNYNKIVGNDEGVDCFFGVLPGISVSKGRSHSVTLKRPYAQLNIGTKDLDVYHKMTSSSINNVGVSVDGVYNCLNLMDGNCVGNPIKVSYPAATLPSGQTFPVKDATYLAMDYLLVKERKNVDVSLKVSNGETSFTNDFSDIPLQRNYQTNIYGNLLTQKKDYKVEINPEFADTENSEINTKPKDYDIILETQYNGELALYYTLNGVDHRIDLSSYIDSNNYVKVNWDELGITKLSNIRFNNGKNPGPGLQKVLKFDVNKIGATDLHSCFARSTTLSDVSAITLWDTSEFTNISGMFMSCAGLTNIDVSNFDTSKVTDMSYTFYNSGLTEIDVSHWDTRNVIDMNHMFQNSRIKNLDLSNWKTENVTDMSYMFGSSSITSQLESINISNWNTSNVTNMHSMFSYCDKLNYIDVSSFDTSYVTDMGRMFYSCRNITELDISHFKTKNVTDMSAMFCNCNNLTSLDVTNFETSNVFNMSYLFGGCESLSYIDVSNFDTSNVTDMSSMFSECNSLASLDVTNFDTSNVVNMSGLFGGCESLSYIDVSNFDTSNVTDMSSMLFQCRNIQSLNLKNFNTSKVTTMASMFHNCRALQSVDLSSFDTSEVTTMRSMFAYCTSLKYLDLSSFSLNKNPITIQMFDNCPAEVIW